MVSEISNNFTKAYEDYLTDNIYYQINFKLKSTDNIKKVINDLH